MTDKAPGARPEDRPHDILAADEFAVPGPDEFRHHGPVVLPSDPSGESAPHDVLAAEAWAMPAPSGAPWGGGLSSRPGGRLRLLAEVVVGGRLLLSLVRRLRGR